MVYMVKSQNIENYKIQILRGIHYVITPIITPLTDLLYSLSIFEGWLESISAILEEDAI